MTASATGAALGLSEWAGLLPFSPASADEAKVTPDLIRFSPEIEPIVRLIEETPREKCVPVFIEQLRHGLPYRHFLAAQYLAAIRAARFHAGRAQGYSHNAFVVHSIHRLSLDLPVAERLLPSFYNIDNFKGMQQGYGKVTGTPELTGTLPPAERADEELHAAMREWDSERAERAIVALARSQGAPRVFEPLWHYAGRDWGFIGHNAILVANSCRLLETIGWQHAEPLLRFIVQGLAGWGKEHAEHPDVRPYWRNLPRVEKSIGLLPGDWAVSTGNDGLTKDLVVLIRESKADEACELAVRHLTEGKAKAGAVWDAVHLAAGELHLGVKLSKDQQWNGNALHANTSTNVIHYAFRVSVKPENRLLLLLQALAWTGLFRDLLRKRNPDQVQDIVGLIGADLPEKPEAAIEDILTTRTAQPVEAARKAFTFALRSPGTGPLLLTANRLLALKTRDVHDIKFAVAIAEDLSLVSPQWQPHVIAAGVYSLQRTDRPENPLMQQVREAAKGL